MVVSVSIILSGEFMKILVLFLTLAMSNLSFAGDQEGGVHTPNYCSTTNVNTCAHLKFEKFPTSTEESQFVAHIFSASGEEVQNVKIKLWMDMGNGHGHGSAPLKFEAMDELNHFYVQNAWFVMTGPWQVIVDFTDAGVEQKIIIPLEIKE